MLVTAEMLQKDDIDSQIAEELNKGKLVRFELSVDLPPNAAGEFTAKTGIQIVERRTSHENVWKKRIISMTQPCR